MNSKSDHINTPFKTGQVEGNGLLWTIWQNNVKLEFFVKIYFGLLFLSPFLAYFIKNSLHLEPNYLLGFIAVVIAIILAFNKNFRIPDYIYPLVLFFLYYSTWDFFNGRYQEFGIIKLLFKNYSLHSIAIILIIENINFSEKFITAAIRIFKILAAISCIVIIYQFVFNSHFFVPDYLISTKEYGNYSRYSSIWGYLSLNSVGLSFLPIMAIVVNHDMLKSKVKQSFLWLGIAGIVVFLTNGRYVMINYLLLLFIPLTLIKGSKIKKIVLSLSAVLMLTFALFEIYNISGIDINKFYKTRIMSKSVDTRILAVKLFSEFFPRHPVFGTGVHVGNDLRIALSDESSQIHVGYLSSLYEYGIVGSTFLFAFWFVVARRFYKVSKVTKQFGIFIGFLLFLFANFSLVSYSVFEVGIIFLFVFNKYYSTKYLMNNYDNSNNYLNEFAVK